MRNELTTKNLILRTPQILDLLALRDFEIRNKAHLEKWGLPDQNTESRLKFWIGDAQSVRFFIFRKEAPEQIIGMCNFTQIFRGPFQSCYLGYKIDYNFEGKGLMFEALQKAIEYVFQDLKLHRIMANYMPCNKRSANLLKRLGFVVEGFAKNYLQINEKWEDHVLTALTCPKQKIDPELPFYQTF